MAVLFTLSKCPTLTEPANIREMHVSAEPQAVKIAAAKWPIWTLAVTILLSAFLLFQVQPLISKWILPWFGGCPAVWTTCMLFFQTLLFGGYVYAHLSQKLLRPRGQVVVHVLLVAAALALMPIAPSAIWKPAGSETPTWHILLLLTFTVGLPYFVLSATSPLVQAWFSRGYPGRSPYRLYALSNFGSLLALLSYPFFFEWALDLPNQSWLWTGGFVLYAALCGLCLAWLWKLRDVQGRGTVPFSLRENRDSPRLRENRDSPQPRAAAAANPAAHDFDYPTALPTVLRRVLWVLLPACASLMLLATTNHVCQDVAVVPFLWVVPLAIYLLSFIVCFDHERWYIRDFWCSLAVLAILAVASIEVLDWLPRSLSFAEQLCLYFPLLFFVCMVCHGELVRLKPDPRHLTEFYLLIAAGGALGGALVTLAAPRLFTTFLEWPIGLGVCYVVAVVVMGLACAPATPRPIPAMVMLLIGATAVWIGAVKWAEDDSVRDRARSFYGVVSVEEKQKADPDKHRFALVHGRIVHGRQFADPAKRCIATSYYGDETGVGQAIRYFNTVCRDRPVRVGAVGLGIGTLATYARPGDQYRFYEINPDILRLAREYFYYLSDYCGEPQGEPEVVMGDARLSLERELKEEGPQNYDVLVLDAFSGDAIPFHLLTCEAFKTYDQHLARDGVIAVHISNKYLYLGPVVRGLAEHFHLETIRISTHDDEEHLVSGADWMLLTRNADLLRKVPPLPPTSKRDDFSVPLWTDQYNNMFQILQGRREE